MRYLARHRTVGAAALIAIGFAVIVAVSGSSAPPAPTLLAVSATELAGFGIDLEAPSASSPVGSDSAAATAVKSFPGASVSQVVLASFSDTNRVPAVHNLAWVVVLVPGPGFRGPSGPASKLSQTILPTYIVVFVDANTGAFIEAISG
jgi:hypothetical protein